MSKNYAPHSCISQVKPPVHRRFATYPDVSCRSLDVRGRTTSGVAGRPGDVRSATTVAERRPSVQRRPKWSEDRPFSADRSGTETARRPGGRRLCADRSGTETSTPQKPVAETGMYAFRHSCISAFGENRTHNGS